MTDRADGAAHPAEAAVTRSRRPPQFYIVDENAAVVFRDAEHSHDPGLPPAVRAAVDRLCAALRNDDQRAMGAEMISSNEVVRVQILHGPRGKRHYAVFIERFAPRDWAGEAARRFGLTARETQVLDGLLRGESTTTIATRLGIAPTTVHEHVRKIGHKTNTTKRSAIVATVLAES
jgi:DNA-binding NarL/FixJ family response regulator